MEERELTGRRFLGRLLVATRNGHQQWWNLEDVVQEVAGSSSSRRRTPARHARLPYASHAPQRDSDGSSSVLLSPTGHGDDGSLVALGPLGSVAGLARRGSAGKSTERGRPAWMLQQGHRLWACSGRGGEATPLG
jgi:hypothetical protein